MAENKNSLRDNKDTNALVPWILVMLVVLFVTVLPPLCCPLSWGIGQGLYVALAIVLVSGLYLYGVADASPVTRAAAGEKLPPNRPPASAVGSTPPTAGGPAEPTPAPTPAPVAPDPGPGTEGDPPAEADNEPTGQEA